MLSHESILPSINRPEFVEPAFYCASVFGFRSRLKKAPLELAISKGHAEVASILLVDPRSEVDQKHIIEALKEHKLFCHDESVKHHQLLDLVEHYCDISELTGSECTYRHQ